MANKHERGVLVWVYKPGLEKKETKLLLPVESLNHVQLFMTPRTVALCPWEFSRQDYWVVAISSQGIFLTEGSNLSFHMPAFQVDCLTLSHLGKLIKLAFIYKNKLHSQRKSQTL